MPFKPGQVFQHLQAREPSRFTNWDGLNRIIGKLPLLVGRFDVLCMLLLLVSVHRGRQVAQNSVQNCVGVL